MYSIFYDTFSIIWSRKFRLPGVYQKNVFSELRKRLCKSRRFNCRKVYFLSNEELGIESLTSGYFQTFTHDVNTFPDTCAVQINNQILQPGLDYVINPISNGTCNYPKCNGIKRYDKKNIEIMDMKHLFEEKWDAPLWGNYDPKALCNR